MRYGIMRIEGVKLATVVTTEGVTQSA